MKYIPKTLTVSIFEDPLSPILQGSGIDENEVELVKFTRPQIKGEHNYEFIKYTILKIFIPTEPNAEPDRKTSASFLSGCTDLTQPWQAG